MTNEVPPPDSPSGPPPGPPSDRRPASEPLPGARLSRPAFDRPARTPGHAPLPASPPSWTNRIGGPILQIGGTVLAVGLITLGLLWNTLFAQMPRLPSRDALWELNREPSVAFVDSKGQTIAVRGPSYGNAVTLDQLPDHVVNAFVAVEDKNFRTHEGVDASAIFRATVENVRAGRTVQGGSTITQQLVKNLFLTPDQTLKRKAQEARLAVELEGVMSKDEILELYLNRTYLGAGAYGIDAAARTYFGTDARNLTVAEAAMLAAFPKAPSRYAAAAATPAARERQHYVLDQMVEARFITAEQAGAAKKQPLHLATERTNLFSGHALDYAVEQVHQLLPNPPPDLVVKLTLDLDLQASAQAAVETGLAEMGAAKQASEAAVIVMDQSGAIRAMVGGRDYATSKFNRAVQARRQPGSSFKMFVYAAALEEGLRPGSVRYDEPIRIGDWAPRNYGGEYRGAVTLSEALAESLNTVAAQIGVEIGVDKVTTLARRFGIRSQLHNYPSVTLGSDEVTLLDITTGYGVLAKGGLQMAPFIIEDIRDTRGQLLFKQPIVVSPRIYPAALSEDMTGMLSRVVVQGTGRGARVAGWDVAGKTGTSQDWRDAWFTGYTTRYVGGVWVGNDNDKPMVKVTGGEMPAVIWSTLMTAALEGIAPEPLPGAKQPEEFLTDDDQDRLSFYRRLASAFSSVEARQGGGAPTL
ncbi:MAG: PBP1A family penicillin-binding protein [Alphaproteobacteria bacterium]|nr:PBP1A family penicillin-binding protein [Alphaproteobacteria bacterium]